MTTTLLPMGQFNDQDAGNGPNGDYTGLPYTAMLFNGDPSTIVQLIGDLRAAGIKRVFVNFAGARPQWTTGGQFDWTKYYNRVKRFLSTADGGLLSPFSAQFLYDAILEGLIIPYAMDEANHPEFNESISPAILNDTCLLHKQFWPGCYPAVRMGDATLADGQDWKFQGVPVVVPPPPYLSVVTGQTEVGWSGLEVGWLQRSGQHNAMDLDTYFTTGHDKLVAVGIPLAVLGLNWWNGGIFVDTDGVDACWPTGQGTGYLNGYNEPGDGNFSACGSVPNPTVNRVVASPDWVAKGAEVAAGYSWAVAYMLWSKTGSGTSVTRTWAVNLSQRADMVAGLLDGLAFCNARSSEDAWPPAKGSPVVTPPDTDVKFDAATKNVSSSTTQSFPHTPIGTPRGVGVIVIHTAVQTDIVTSVTYGGVTLSREELAIATSPDGAAYLYFLGASIPTGVQTVIVNKSSGVSSLSVAITVTAGANTEVVDSDHLDVDLGSNPSRPLTYGGRTCLTLAGVFSGRDSVSGVTELAGLTRLHTNDFGTDVGVVSIQDVAGSSDLTAGYTIASDAAALVVAAISTIQATASIGQAGLHRITGGVGPRAAAQLGGVLQT